MATEIIKKWKEVGRIITREDCIYFKKCELAMQYAHNWNCWEEWQDEYGVTIRYCKSYKKDQ